MQRKPIVVGDPPTSSVRGLGVCDVLEIEIAPVQLPWLIDELDEIRGPLEEELVRERATWALSGGQDTEAVDAAEYELVLLRAMRARLPATPIAEPVTFAGPSGMVMSVVRGTVGNVTAALGELAASLEARDAQGRAVLRSTAAAAAAWVETFVDCETVVGFNFDPDADPMRSW